MYGGGALQTLQLTLFFSLGLVLREAYQKKVLGNLGNGPKWR